MTAALGLGHNTALCSAIWSGLIDLIIRGRFLSVLESRCEFTIQPLERIAQMVIVPVVQVGFNIVVENFAESDRGAGGFGSTGKH